MAIPVPEKRIREFEELGFGMIIHWGLYAQVGLGERYREFSGVKKEDYEKLTETSKRRPVKTRCISTRSSAVPLR